MLSHKLQQAVGVHSCSLQFDEDAPNGISTSHFEVEKTHEENNELVVAISCGFECTSL
jgi:hypothetical protein